jgi:hypothetical protein
MTFILAGLATKLVLAISSSFRRYLILVGK